MRGFAVLIFVGFIFVNCSKVETTSDEKTHADSTVFVSPTVEADLPLKSTAANVESDSKQVNSIDKTLPAKVWKILEKAEKFEVLAEVDESDENDGLDFEPNRIAYISDENTKKEILKALHSDIGRDAPIACYIPHHGLRATYNRKTIEIEICYQCTKFYAKSPFGEFSGIIGRKNKKSEDIFNRINQNQSVRLK